MFVNMCNHLPAVLTNISTQRVKGNSLQFMVWILLQMASLENRIKRFSQSFQTKAYLSYEGLKIFWHTDFLKTNLEDFYIPSSSNQFSELSAI